MIFGFHNFKNMKRISFELDYKRFMDTVVEEKIVFEDTIFEKKVVFTHVEEFLNQVIFSNCVFESSLYFHRCNFQNGIQVQNCHFTGSDFSIGLFAVQCNGNFELLNCILDSKVEIIDSFFNGKTIFHKTEFKQSINLFDPNSESFGSVDFVGGLSIFR